MDQRKFHADFFCIFKNKQVKPAFPKAVQVQAVLHLIDPVPVVWSMLPQYKSCVRPASQQLTAWDIYTEMLVWRLRHSVHCMMLRLAYADSHFAVPADTNIRLQVSALYTDYFEYYSAVDKNIGYLYCNMPYLLSLLITEKAAFKPPFMIFFS